MTVGPHEVAATKRAAAIDMVGGCGSDGDGRKTGTMVGLPGMVTIEVVGDVAAVEVADDVTAMGAMGGGTQ